MSRVFLIKFVGLPAVIVLSFIGYCIADFTTNHDFHRTIDVGIITSSHEGIKKMAFIPPHKPIAPSQQ